MTVDAKNRLSEHEAQLKNEILNYAERNMLDQNRTEISEQDIENSIKNTIITSHLSKKWVMRFFVGIAVSLLIQQIHAFSLLPDKFETWRQVVNLFFSIRVVLPTLFALIFLILYSFCFKEYLI